MCAMEVQLRDCLKHVLIYKLVPPMLLLIFTAQASPRSWVRRALRRGVRIRNLWGRDELALSLKKWAIRSCSCARRILRLLTALSNIA